MRRLLVLLVAAFAMLPVTVTAAGFEAIREEARGQTVYFNAWGGSTQINDYIAWVGDEVEARFGVALEHVKLTDTADAVARVLAEKAAGRTDGGSIDLIWINGENFRSMKEGGLLHGPFTQELPNFALVDTAGKPTTLVDFTVPTDGLESPWGMAQFVLIHDKAVLEQPPTTIDAILDYAEANPGRITYPHVSDFIGTTFVKQVLVDRLGDRIDLSAAPPSDADAVLDPVFAYLDALHPQAWRDGKSFPPSGPAMHQLFEDGEIDLTMAFNPAEASSLVIEGRFPESTRSYTLEGGTIANTHFVAIPFNASNKAGGKVVADFLLSPLAQARKQDARYWGDFTVLDVDALAPAERGLFEALERHPATPPPEAMGAALPEPHPQWVDVIERAWTERYQR